MNDQRTKANQGFAMLDSGGNYFERFENSVKTSIFNVLYVLLKEDETSYWKHIAIIILDYIQIFYYPFNRLIKYPWHGGEVQDYWEMFLEFFQINYWLEKLDLTSYIVFFYICVSAICLILMNAFFVQYSFGKRKFTFMWPIMALRLTFSLITTVLFLPFLDTFTTMINCNSQGGSYSNFLYPDFQCWTGIHIVHASIAIIFSVLFLAISFIVSLTYYDCQITSANPTARIHSRGEAFINFEKVILVYLFAFFGKDDYQWFQIAIMLGFSYAAFQNYRSSWPYYNDRINKLHIILSGLFFWANCVLFLNKVLEKSEFSGGLQLYFLGVPLLIALVIYDKDERSQILMRNMEGFQSGESVAHKIRFFLNIVQNRNEDRRSAIILKGYVFQHEDECPSKDCQLKHYKEQLMTSTKQKKDNKKQHHPQSLSSSSDNSTHLLEFAKSLYREGLKKFPESTALKIQYAFFLMERMNRKAEAFQEFNQASNYNPPFDEQFIIYRFKMMHDDYADGIIDGTSNSGHAYDMMTKLAYEASLKKLQSQITKCAQMHFQFWSFLREERPDMSKINQCGSQINLQISQIEQLWVSMQKLSLNNPKALKIYAKFLIEILNDKDTGNDLMNRAKDALNNKQIYLSENQFGESELSEIYANGFPCVYVTGDSDKIGMITQCNAGASRIFGYTAVEMKNHNVEKLMPEMYAKNHSRILDDALAKGPDNIPNKERLVFARHKSGYIFPVWLQLKMVNSMQNGVQFVALFKIDKKVMSSNFAYILINKEKKIHGISSTCIKMLNLDLQKIRKLAYSRIDITKIVPELFDHQMNIPTFQQKAGQNVDWYIPDFNSKKKNQMFSVQSDKRYRSIEISNEKLSLFGSLNPIIMGELGEIGQYMKLELPQVNKLNGLGNRKVKAGEKLKQPLFQFRLDQATGRFVRELRQETAIDLGIKNPNFINGKWKTYTNEDPNDQQAPQVHFQKNQSNIEEIKIDRQDLNQSHHKNEDELFTQRKKWGAGINIYCLVEGKFQTKDFDEEQKKSKIIEEERLKRAELKNPTNTETFKNNIKSKKALQLAINDKSTPQVIRNLRVTMNIVMIILLILAITEFTLINSAFEGINRNFGLISLAYARIAEVQRIAFNIRTLVLIKEGSLNATSRYSTDKDLFQEMKLDTEMALNNLYDLQNEISLSPLGMAEEQDKIVNQKSVILYFKDSNQTLKSLEFSLNEAIMQVASAIFTVRYLPRNEVSEAQEDIYFVTYNCFNDFMISLTKSSKLYYHDLVSRADSQTAIIMALFYVSIAILILSMVLLCPVVSSVNKTRMNVLSLFIEIPNFNILLLSNKCENYLSTILDEQHDDIESDDGDQAKIDDLDQTKVVLNRRSGSKKAKNQEISNKLFFAQFGLAVLVMLSYFLAFFLLSQKYINDAKIQGQEMNLLANAEFYYSFTQNSLREMIYNPNKTLLNRNSFDVTRDQINQGFRVNQIILDHHFSERAVLSQDYKDQYALILNDNLCDQDGVILNFTNFPNQCETFMAGSAKYVVSLFLTLQGLKSVLSRYFESLKEGIKLYVNLREEGRSTMPLFNTDLFAELYIINSKFIKPSFRDLVASLHSSVDSSYQALIDGRMAGFVIFVIGMSVAYLVLWTPFVTKLNNEIWKTKSMLTIIPIDVISKMPSMHEYLNNQNFFNKQKDSK